MWNLLISIAIAAAVAAGVGLGTNFGWIAAVVPAFVALVAAYFVLARRSMKQLGALMDAVQKEMQKEAQTRRFEKSIEKLKSGFALAPWQFLVGSQIHGHVGVLQYMQRQYDAALPHLEKSYPRHWIARGMLAALRYQRKDVAGAKVAFEAAVRDNKKEGVLWAAYAWVLEKEGAHEEAIAVLGRGVKANPSDEKLKTCQQTLQNGKKLKLGKIYEEQWFQFLLEAPPNPSMSPMFRGNRRALYRGG
jgi:tetratricopeptide (TPR) repeat protein